MSKGIPRLRRAIKLAQQDWRDLLVAAIEALARFPDAWRGPAADLLRSDIVQALGVARSNVSNSLKELQGWGIVKRVHVMGDARDHFESMKDVWEMFRVVLDERKKREIDPTERMLREAAKRTCEALKEKPWQGFVTEAENGRLVLSTGSTAGLAAGAETDLVAYLTTSKANEPKQCARLVHPAGPGVSDRDKGDPLSVRIQGR